MFAIRRIQSFIFGLKLPFRALKLILGKKSLLSLSLLPIAITSALYFYVIVNLQEWASDQIRLLIESFGWSPEHWTAWFFSLMAQITILIASALTFAFVSSIVASPFNDFLAERTERYSDPPLEKADGTGFKHQFRLILIDLAKTIASATAAIFALLLSWVPIVNLVTFAISFMLVCFQYTSYPQTRRNIGLKEGLRFLWRHSYACIGFGATVSFLFAMPFVSVLALPAAVVGGTLLVARAPGDSGVQPLK